MIISSWLCFLDLYCQLIHSLTIALFIYIKIQEKIITSTDLSSREKSIMSLNLARADKYLVDGCDEYLQLLRLLSSAVV